MPLPAFVKSGVPTFTFSRGDAFPRTPEPGDEGQIVSQSTAGTLRVHTMRPPLLFVTLNFAENTALPEADYLGMEAFLRHNLIKLRANPFTFTDSDGTVRTVRYWRGLYQFVRISTTLRRGSLVLRIEPTA